MPGLRLRLGMRYASDMMRRHVLRIGMAAISLTAACSTDGGHANFDLKKVPGSTVFESEKDYASTIVDGRYRLFNNVWNKGATTGHYRQKIFVNDENGKAVFGWAWKWRDSSAVVTYPEIQVGQSPWASEASPDEGFPFQTGAKKLIANLELGDEVMRGSGTTVIRNFAVTVK
jgi:hypothetical protein